MMKGDHLHIRGEYTAALVGEAGPEWITSTYVENTTQFIRLFKIN